MSKTKKILTSIIIGIFMILGFYQVSDAATYITYKDSLNLKVGDKIRVNYGKYINSDYLYCMQHGRMLRARYSNYEVVSEINIKGNISKDHTGKSITNKNNAIFAYILSANNGETKELGPVAKDVWLFKNTWMSQVGRKHAGLSMSFTEDEKGAEMVKPSAASEKLLKEAREYANNLGTLKEKIVDKTDKSKITVTAYRKDNKDYTRVGPFKWEFAGKLTSVAVKNQNNQAITATFSKFEGKTEKTIGVGEIISNKEFYISVPVDQEIKNLEGIIRINSVKSVDIWFLNSTNYKYQNLVRIKPSEESETIKTDFDYDIPTKGNLKVIKVDKDNHVIKLANVGFKIQYQNGKYVHRDGNAKITYVDSINDATEFVTGKDGNFTVKDLLVGTYTAYETKNPNAGYEIITQGQSKKITVDKTAELTIENQMTYIKLSGFVWVDKQDGKTSLRNDLYKTNKHPEINNYVDGADILLDGVTVRLKDKRTGNIVRDKDGNRLETKTANGGAYLFANVLLRDLGNYYVEFEYDGLTYTNVVPHLTNEQNGSKSAENEAVRDRFNKDFSVVEGKTENTSITRDANGNQKHTLNYNLNPNKHTATLINNGQYPIVANTNETGYNIKDHYKPGVDEIKYINLGLYERETPDIALTKDIESVRVAINGYQHIYQYAQRFNNQGEFGDGFNVGVKFGEKYGTMSYSRAIYQADYEYRNDKDSSRELKVYITYRLGLKNQSTNLVTRVNSMVDYYDSNYGTPKVGTGIDKEGNITGKIATSAPTAYNSNYQKIIINTNTKIDPQKQADIYVQFELNREAVLKILNDKENLNNVAEVNSYSVFDKTGKVYAGIDKDSNPGNLVPDNKATYQDDSDSAPGLKLEVADARELTGKVFLDSTSGELMTGKVRQGSGIYENGEAGIAGVKVTLKENAENGKVYETTTDNNGDFKIAGFIPGDYTLTYTWGDKTYTVQNYKGTVYDSTRNQSDKNWYKTDVDTRKTDAIDDYVLRENIDNEMKTINHDTKTTIETMNSTTPIMGIGVEYETTTTASTGDKYTYQIRNVDFGIVERARQNLTLGKRVKTFKLTLANGQVISDVTIDETGKMTGEKKHISYMKPSQSASPANGYVRVELDNEIIQGAVVEVGYAITATNNSELDYVSERFYKYGIAEGNKVTMSPTAIVDYLDKDWAFDADKNKDWQVKRADEIKDMVAETVYKDKESTIGEKTILYTETLKEQKLEPEKSAEVMINVSKVLSTADEIYLDNETEILKVEKTGGSNIPSTPGNYVPGKGHQEIDDSMAETILVTPNTGANLDFIIPVMVGIVACVILGVGVIFIKKKTLGEKE